jgi:tRNA G18 (ribose-2'-O)-methylase SpoU
LIEHIDRPDDPRIAAYAEVGDHGRLRSRGLFVAEGRFVVQRLIAIGRFGIESIAVTPAALARLRDGIEKAGVPVFVCAPQILEAVTGFDFHRGCLALVRRPPRALPLDSFADARRLLALEGVGNPDNLGGLFRVAAAFAADGVVLDESCADPFYRKAVRTSMGAVLRVPFTRASDWIGTIRRLRSAGLRIAAFTPAADATPLEMFATRLPRGARLALLFGAEGPGLSGAALRAADDLVRIPIAGDVDSLNVTVAAGIALASLQSADAA